MILAPDNSETSVSTNRTKVPTARKSATFTGHSRFAVYSPGAAKPIDPSMMKLIGRETSNLKRRSQFFRRRRAREW